MKKGKHDGQQISKHIKMAKKNFSCHFFNGYVLTSLYFCKPLEPFGQLQRHKSQKHVFQFFTYLSARSTNKTLL